MEGKSSPDSGIESLAVDVLESAESPGDLVSTSSVNVKDLEVAEEELGTLNENEEAKIKVESEKTLQEVGAQEAYRKLQILLEKSNVYADLILARMEQEQQKALKRKKIEVKKEAKEKMQAAPVAPLTRLRKRKASMPKAEPSQLSEFFDKKVLSKKRGQYLTEDIPTLNTLSTKNVAFECDLKYFTGGTLRDYQIEGLCWLKTQFEQGINGILADEMGLGKTIQCIALFSHFYAKGMTGPFLVVGPLSTLPNWYSEFRRFAPKLPVVLYHGHKDKRAVLRNQIIDGVKLNGVLVKPVILTSYEVVMADRNHVVQFQPRYLVIDEGHRVKNHKCMLLKTLRCFPCSRLLMTGTPLQNNLSELWSLLNFLLPEIFSDLNWFETFFAFQTVNSTSHASVDINNLDAEEQDRERQILSKLHNILKPFLLRRIKTDVELKLPPKREIWVYAPLTNTQIEYYKAAVDKFLLQFCGKCIQTEVQGKRRSIMRPETMIDDVTDAKENKRPVEQHLTASRCIMMALREICLHPYLIEYPLTSDNDYLIDEQLIKKSGKMLVFDRLVTALIAQKHKILVFSQFCMMLNLLQDYCYYLKLDYCRLDGSMSLEERQVQIEKFTNDPDVHLFLISTNAGGLGLNLTAADTVIIFDSSWNPQGDLQAQDRCHRIGQSKPVVVYRLICRNTVDERLIESAAKKRKLEKMVIHAGKFQFLRDSSRSTSLSKQELAELLKSTDYSQLWEIDPEALEEANERVISDRDLTKLLDRCQIGNSDNKSDDTASEAFKVEKYSDSDLVV